MIKTLIQNMNIKKSKLKISGSQIDQLECFYFFSFIPTSNRFKNSTQLNRRKCKFSLKQICNRVHLIYLIKMNLFLQFKINLYNYKLQNTKIKHLMQQKYLIGTLFQQEQQNKKMNIHNTKAKDPMGNVRWKGAFTGGFEAGYKNTCGTKQGWVPSSFISSIGSRTQRKQQNIFDYMDKQDLGRQSIGQNISMRNTYTLQNNNPLNISLNQSLGQQILTKLKKKCAFINAPQDIKQLDKLLQNYEQQQILKQQIQNYNIKGIQGYNSVDASQNIPDDDFIVAYQDFFHKVIRSTTKQQTQQQIKKRRQQNKIYFDFTRPIDQQPQYLKQIQQIQQTSKPKKRRRNVINDKKLKDIFIIGLSHLHIKQNNNNTFVQDVPQGYDPYHRIKLMKQKQKQFVIKTQQKRRHKIHNLNQRSDLLGEGKLSAKFVSASSNISTNKFIRANQQQTAKQLQKVFQDPKKNKRYWDYVQQLQGKKISAQMQYLSYEEAQKQKNQFQKVYRLKQLPQNNVNNSKSLPTKVQQALKNKNKKQIKVIRKIGFWKPQKLLCKRFGCVLPYKQEKVQQKQKYYN